jgi:hypothetical protein
MQSEHHFQVETDQATSTRDVSSTRTNLLVKMALGFGCFMLGVASVCLVHPSSSHTESLQKSASPDLAYVPMGMPVRASPENVQVSKFPSIFLPRTSPVSIATAAMKRRPALQDARGNAPSQGGLAEFREQQADNLRQWLRAKFHDDGLKAAAFAKAEEQRMAVEAAAKADQDRLEAAALAKAEEQRMAVQAAAKADQDRLEAAVAAENKAADWKLQIDNYRLENKAEKERLTAAAFTPAADAPAVAGRARDSAASNRWQYGYGYGYGNGGYDPKKRWQYGYGYGYGNGGYVPKNRVPMPAAAPILVASDEHPLIDAARTAASRKVDEATSWASLDDALNTLEAVGEVSTNTAEVDYSAKTVVELKEVLRSRGLKLSGSKATLVARLQDDDKWKPPHGYDPKLQDAAVTPPADGVTGYEHKNRASARASPPQDAEDMPYLLPKPMRKSVHA